MKKYISLIFCILLSFFSFGFVNPQENYIDNTKFSHAVMNDGSNITETFAVNLTTISAINDVTETLLYQKFNFELSKLLVEFQQKIADEQDVEKRSIILNSVAGICEKTDELIYIKISYSSNEAWNYFSRTQGDTKKIQRLFTYDYYEKVGKAGGKTSLSGTEMFIGEYLQKCAFDLLDVSLLSWKGDAKNMSSYTYITKIKRLHSSCDSLISSSELYYHQWLLDNDNPINFWTTRPNVVVWYITAVVAGLLVMLVVFLIGLAKGGKKKKIQIEQNNTENIQNSKPVMFVKIENDDIDIQ